MSGYKVTIVSFCGDNKIMTPRPKTVAVTVVVGKELLQDRLLRVVAANSQRSTKAKNS